MVEDIARLVHEHHLSAPAIGRARRGVAEDLETYLHNLDPYSRYIPPPQDQVIGSKVEKRRFGIGADIIRQKKHILILPYLDGPLYRSGVREPAYLVTVDGHPVTDMSLEDIARLLSQSQQERVEFGLTSQYSQTPTLISGQKGKFQSKSIEYKEYESTHLIRIREFVARETMAKLRATIKHTQTKATKTLVLDLRFCAGGDVFEAVDATSLFLPQGLLLAVLESAVSPPMDLVSQPGWRVLKEPILALIGPGTASACEIFAMILQYYGQALLVGTRSYGKCLSQGRYELADGGMLELTNMRVLGPGRESCEGQGLSPNVETSIDDILLTTILVDRGLDAMRK